jgi:hypothetical protein
MKKAHIGFVLLASLFLAACMKAYTPVVNSPITFNDILGSYKSGKLKWEKALLDTVTYRGVSETSTFMINGFIDDSIFVSINSDVPLVSKRYKMPMYAHFATDSGAVYYFAKIETLSTYYLYNFDYKVKVYIYYPSSNAQSYATITNNHLWAEIPKSVYTEKVDFTAYKQ